jgi:hypothetical protein
LFVANATTPTDKINASKMWKQVFADVSLNAITVAVGKALDTRLVGVVVVGERSTPDPLSRL